MKVKIDGENINQRETNNQRYAGRNNRIGGIQFFIDPPRHTQSVFYDKNVYISIFFSLKNGKKNNV